MKCKYAKYNVHMYIYTCIYYIYIHTYTYIQMHTYIYMNTCVHINTQMHVYAHTYIYRYIAKITSLIVLPCELPVRVLLVVSYVTHSLHQCL